MSSPDKAALNILRKRFLVNDYGSDEHREAILEGLTGINFHFIFLCI